MEDRQCGEIDELGFGLVLELGLASKFLLKTLGFQVR